jgi:hypothetical protein
MEGPTLVLVPPTPVRNGLPPLPTASTSPGVSRLTSFEKERGSSETTIFTIYSMYGDDGARHSEEGTSNEAITSNHLTNGSGDHLSAYRHSAYQQSARSMNSDVIVCDTSSESQVSSKYGSAADLPARTSVTSDGSVHLSYLDDRPLPMPASYSGTRSSTQQSLDTLRLPKTNDLTRSTLRASFTFPATETSRDAHLRRPLTHSRSPSTSLSVSANGDSSTSHHHPVSSRTRTPELLAPPKSPLSSQLGNSPELASPASKSSLVPSEGEDVDAFYVRNTYAELEMTGVKGDGYEEGLERTRARLGGSRASELMAEEALDDGTEKRRELSPKEIETLASLDRSVYFLMFLIVSSLLNRQFSYGFFTIPSHDRLILLRSAPLTKRLTRVSAGPKNAPANATSLSSLPPAPHPTKETFRIAKWNRMLEPRARDEGGNIDAWGIKPSKEQKLRERTYKGIPDRWRRAAWDLLMGRFSRTGKRELLKLSEEYRDALEKPSTYDVQIDLDVPRTISGHIMFRTRYGSGYVVISFGILIPHSNFRAANDLCFTSCTRSRYGVPTAGTYRAWVQ